MGSVFNAHVILLIQDSYHESESVSVLPSKDGQISQPLEMQQCHPAPTDQLTSCDHGHHL